MKKLVQTLGIFFLPVLGDMGTVVSQIITSGGFYSIFLCNNSSAIVCGRNENGEFGNGTSSYFPIYPNPISISTISDITDVSAGYYHSVFLKRDGTVWACGQNSEGQLGDGTLLNKLSPIRVNALNNAIAISAGGYHSHVLRNDGTVWSFGNNGGGALGDGTKIQRTSPVQVLGLSNITAISASVYRTLFLKNDGTVWSCGRKYGIGGIFDSVPTQIISLSNITAISDGSDFSLFLKNDGSVWACGENSFGQFGTGLGSYIYSPAKVAALSDIIAISADPMLNGGWYGHSLFLKRDGTVWASGENLHGELGNGTFWNNFGDPPNQVNNLSNIVAISARGAHSTFVKSDGTVWTCGRNKEGQLGDGTTVNKNIPVQVTTLCSLVGMKKVTDNFKNNIYPNPFDGKFSLIFENLLMEEYQVHIFNSFGACIFKKKYLNPNIDLDLSTQPNGIFYIEVSQNDAVYKSKIIKE